MLEMLPCSAQDNINKVLLQLPALCRPRRFSSMLDGVLPRGLAVTLCPHE
jgi:hypothetical protein